MKKHHFSEKLVDSGGLLDLLVEIGNVTIQTHEERQVVVDAETRHMDVSVRRKGNTIFVSVEQNEEARRWRNRLFGGMQTRAEVTVFLPRDCEVRARTVTGRLTISDVAAPVKAKVITGRLQLSNLGGPIDATTVTGRVEYQGLLSDENHSFKTTTGSLRLRLAEIPNAQLDMRTVTGNVQCDFPLKMEQVSRQVVGTHLRGTLGKGGGHIRGRVVTGSLHLQSAHKEQLYA